MNIREAEESLRTMVIELPRAAVDAADQALSLLQERAEDLSSGPATAADLRRAGHPYRRPSGGKRRKGAALARNPEVINIQSGDFVSAWGHHVDLEGAEVGGEVFNTDPKAELLASGTDAMVPRPLPDAVVAEMEAEVMRTVERRLMRALGG